jgi:DNA processing protein
MKHESLKYNVGFSLIPGIGRVRLAQLEAHFGNLELAWGAPPEELRRAGLENSAVNAIKKHREHVELDRELENLDKLGVRAVTWRDDAYPERLKEIYDYPPLLYIKGELIPADEWCLAVVGTRRPGLYGRQVTEELVTDLVASGITIVSGLAKGLDTAAHQCALKGGRTVAVLAGGLDRIYPIENTSLARLVAQQGALISEYPPGLRPRPDFFPRRNRILSGLSRGYW